MTPPAAPAATASLPPLSRAAELETLDTERRTVEVVWTTGATVRRGGFWTEPFDETLEVSREAIRLERMSSGRMNVLDSHGEAQRYGAGSSLDSVIGVVERAWIDGTVGRAVIRFGRSARAERVWADVADGVLRNVSVSYRVHRFRDVTAREDEVRQLLAIDWEPLEVSIVAIPADAGAGVRSQQDPLSPVVIEGHESMKPNHKQGAAAPVEERQVEQPEPTGAEPRADERAAEPQPTRQAPRQAEPAAPVERQADDLDARVAGALVAERQRSSAIVQLVERHGLERSLADQLIADGSTLEAARSAVLDAIAERHETEELEAPVRSTVRVVDAGAPPLRRGLVEALLHRAAPDRHELTDLGRQYRGLRLSDVAARCLEAVGIRTRGMTPVEIAERAMHTTSDLPNVLLDAAGKSLRRAYEEAPATWSPLTRPRFAPDFKPLKSVQLSAAPNLEETPEGAEHTYGAMTDSQEVYSVTTKSRRSALTRTAVVNDDLDAFSRVPAAFGLSAARSLSSALWALLTANAAMADGNNLFSGAHANDGTTILTDQTDLQELTQKLMLQTGLQGEPLNLSPRFLIVPPQLQTIALALTTATTPRNAGDVNPWAGVVSPIVEQRLSGAASTWYVASGTEQVDILEVAYLEGRDAPMVLTRQGWEVEGIEIKCIFDYGVKAIDWRGIARSVGSTA